MENKMYIGKKKEKFRHWRLVLDIFTLVLAIITIAFAVYVFLMVEERIKWLPLVFLGAAFLNLIEGCKKMYYAKYLPGALLFVSALAITAFAVVSYMAIWR